MSSGKWQPFCLGLNVLRISTTHTMLVLRKDRKTEVILSRIHQNKAHPSQYIISKSPRAVMCSILVNTVVNRVFIGLNIAIPLSLFLC